MIPFDLTHPLPTGRVVLEASAGTGKTYSLTGLVVRYIAERRVPVDQVLVVTFTRAAANELRERTRQTLDTALGALTAGVAPPTHEWMSVLLETGVDQASAEHANEISRRGHRVAEAISRFDDLTITTIHGFCQQTLAQLGVRSGQHPDATLVEATSDVVKEVCRDLIITTLADDPHALDAPRSAVAGVTNPKQAEVELVHAVTTMMNNPGALVVPGAPNEPLAARWVELTRAAHEQVARRQLERNEIGYDALIAGVQRALADPDHGPAVASQLSARSSVVLVDEFQDTDRVQWDVFRRAFAAVTLITVGDPKQAIYRFRGADVHAYLDAVDASSTLSLGVNHRSDVAVLAGIGQLLDGATLGDARIPFTPVSAGPAARETALRRDDGTAMGPAVQLRAVPLADSLRSTRRPTSLSMPLVRSLVLDDLTARTIELLDHGHIDLPDGGSRPVEPGDIAVLVPSHAEGENVAGALRRAGVPAARTRTGSVLASPAAMQWRILLAALAQPHRSPLVRAAALGWFVRTDVVALTDDDEVVADLQARTARLAERMRRAGVAAFYDEQKMRASVPTRDVPSRDAPSRDMPVSGLLDTVLGQPGGERNLTDLDHIAELLSAAMVGRPTEPAQVLRTLEMLIGDDDGRSDGVMRRIDSDARAVQITTIHGAKGLEYPVVLIPFAFKARPNVSSPFSFADPDGKRTLDLASKVEWDGGLLVPGDETTRNTQELRRKLAADEVDGDELRLLYVALTRARHRVEVWWAATMSANGTALGRLLLDRYGAGPVQNTPVPISLYKQGKHKGQAKINKPEFHGRKELDAIEQIRTLVRDSDGTLALVELAEHIEPGTWGGRVLPSTTALQLATSPRPSLSDPRWQQWSFTRLTANVHESAAGAPPGEALPAAADVRRIDDRGGFDEPSESGAAGEGIDPVEDLADIDQTPASTGEQLQLGVGPLAHLADVPGGARFGTFAHAVLEHLDCTSPDLHTEVRSLVIEHAAREGLVLGVAGGAPQRDGSLDAIVDGIVAAVRTPLGPLFGQRCLAQLAPRDRLTELVFDLPITSTDGHLPAGAIGEVVARHLAPADPMRVLTQTLVGQFAGVDIAGWMHGSIDGLFRASVDGTDRYIVVDYKSNRLHTDGAVDPVAAYHPRLLMPAMDHSQYLLQALLYSVAVHRYLRWRLGRAYRPDDHLGGVAYLYLRGMVGPDTPAVDGVPHGVFSWRPPAAAITALDRLFATGRAE